MSGEDSQDLKIERSFLLRNFKVYNFIQPKYLPGAIAYLDYPITPKIAEFFSCSFFKVVLVGSGEEIEIPEPICGNTVFLGSEPKRIGFLSIDSGIFFQLGQPEFSDSFFKRIERKIRIAPTILSLHNTVTVDNFFIFYALKLLKTKPADLCNGNFSKRKVIELLRSRYLGLTMSQEEEDLCLLYLGQSESESELKSKISSLHENIRHQLNLLHRPAFNFLKLYRNYIRIPPKGFLISSDEMGHAVGLFLPDFYIKNNVVQKKTNVG